MSPDNQPAAGKDSSTNRKTSSSSSRAQEAALKCPRCDSPNTKFCYYNNYSLTQPRHFCKTCRRYWTRGGALRSVPIGGGCRKNKKMTNIGSSSSENGGLKFFQGVSPAMDFQLNVPRFHSSPTPTPTTALFNHFSDFGLSSNTSPATSSTPTYNLALCATNTPLIGFDFPANQQMGFRSSIESLSSINQYLHWKMQKQRLGMLMPEDNQKRSNQENSIEPDFRKPQPILFGDLEVPSKAESPRTEGGGVVGNLSTEWFFDNSYATPDINAESSSGWTAWSDLSQYSSIP